MKNPSRIMLLVLILVPAWAVEAAPAASDVQALLLKHMQAFNEGQLDATLAGYDESAVLVTGAGITKGKEAIRKLFERILTTHPHLDLKAQFFTDDVGYIGWVQNAGTSNEITGADTFIVRGGKITVQTVTAVRPTAATPPPK